ncbi:NUDIX hydrolase [Glycomyces arizonensis]|uniref:NUDIX hydrolase n=1 Tax=Glycomyces arizonensis TaxID=256035 RepID=UPI0003F5921B|nr:NUDIX domain-containing protein [Glycomyces arizonensis]
MADENAAVGLARLAGKLRAEATNGLFWGGGDAELARLRLLRRHAAALMAEVDHRPLAEIEAIFEADKVLRSPLPATEFRIRCADGGQLVQRRRLSRSGESLGRRLNDLAEALETEAPTDVLGIADTDLAGLPCPHTFLLVYEAATPLTASEAARRLAPSDPDLNGPIEALPPAASAVVKAEPPLPVSSAVSAVLGEVARIGKEGVAAAESIYNLERHERVVAMCANTVETGLAYDRIDCGDLAAEPASTGADAAIFDDRDRLLLIRRTDTGQWAVPGGGSEVGETVGLAAVREAFEETGLDVTLTGLERPFDKRDVGSGGDARFPLIMSFSARMTDPEQPIRLAELEASEYRWVTWDEIADIDFFKGHDRRVPDAFAAHRRLRGR